MKKYLLEEGFQLWIFNDFLELVISEKMNNFLIYIPVG